MGTPQNPSQSTNQNRAQSTKTNPNPVPVPAGPKVPSYEEVSALFTLPLSDAADSLGVSPTVLKSVCYENGLGGWPFRKLVAGKSIEEIKKDAAREREKQFSESNVARKKSDSSHSMQGTPSNMQSTATNRGNSTTTSTLDEFKYGFPSEGLTTVSNKWWSNKSSADESSDRSEASETKPEQTLWPANSLSSLRKKVAIDSERALKLGINRGYKVKTLDKTKKLVLHQIFQSNFPDEWGE